MGISKKINKWERLTFLLSLINTVPQVGSAKMGDIEHQIKLWDLEFNKSSSQPTPQQIEQIRELHDSLGTSTNGYSNRSVSFTLKSFGI